MITPGMTLDQRTNILSQASRLVGRRGFIAGGYVRDTMFGKVPKDMDIFVRMPDIRTKDRLMAIARVILAQFGYEPNEELVDAQEDAYGNIEGGNFACVKGKSDDPIWGPIDIIFHTAIGGRREWFVGDHFDLNICKCFMNSVHQPVITLEAREAFLGVPQRLRYNRRYSAEQMAQRLLHLREKYPQLKMAWDGNLLLERQQDAYYEYLKEGVIGDPRAVLQEEAEGVDGDQVGLNAREEPQRIRDLGVIADELQEEQNPVHNNEGVQPRLRAFHW